MNRPLTISGLILFSVILSCICRMAVGDSDCPNVSPELETCAKEAMIDGLCSTEGRQSFSCILEFRQLCPTSALEEVLVSKVHSSGGIESYCSVDGNLPIAAEGDCNDKCLQYALQAPDAESIKIGQKLQDVSGKAIYLGLPYILERQCGPMKAYNLCLMDIYPTCHPKDTSQSDINKSIYYLGMMSKFIRSYCSIDNGLSSHADCASTAMNTTVFSKCLNKTLAEIKGNKNCASYNLVKQCVTKAVAPSCGNEAARLVSAGMSQMYSTYIPIDCETPAVSHASGTQASSLTLLGGLSVFIMHRMYHF